MAVVIETTIGDFTVDLFTVERPRTCLNFLKLCKIKYYNFCLFHSVQNNFIAQTGDPTGSGKCGESIYGKVFGEKAKYYEGEQVPKIKHHKAGLLSMVNCGNNMFGSQFFITLAKDLQSLDSEHCVFGEIAEGQEVILKLNETICDQDHRPFQDIRITHTVILEDPFDDPAGLIVPECSPEPTKENLQNGRIAPDEEIDETKGLSVPEIEEMQKAREAKAQATILEIVGDLPDAEMAPPENVLFVCKLNPVTTDADLEIIFSRFGKIKSCEVIRDKTTGDSLQYAFIEFEERKSCEDAYFKMDNVLIDDRRIHVDFSQSVAKLRWKGKGRGVEHLDEHGNVRKDPVDLYYNKYDNKTSHRTKEKPPEDGWDIEELSSTRRGHHRGSSEQDRSGHSRSKHRSRHRSRSRDRSRRERGSSHHRHSSSREERRRRDDSGTPSKGSKREDEAVGDRRDKQRRSKERTKDESSKYKSSDAEVEKNSKYQRQEQKDSENKKSNNRGGKESESCDENDQKKLKDRKTSKNGLKKHQRESESCDEVAQKKQDEDRKDKRSEAKNTGSSDKAHESNKKDGQKVSKSIGANEDVGNKNIESIKVKEAKLPNELKKSNSVELQPVQEESSSKSKYPSKNDLNNGTSSTSRESQKDGDKVDSKPGKKINEKKSNKPLDSKKHSIVNERDVSEKAKDRKRRKDDTVNEKTRKKLKRHSSSSSDVDSSSVSDSSGDSDSDSSSSSSSSSYDAKKVRKKKHPKKATVVAKKTKKKRKLKKKLHRKKGSDSDGSSSDSSHSRKGKKKYKGKRKRKSSALQDDSNSDVGRKKDKKKKKVLLKRKRKNSSSEDSSSECESSSSSSSSTSDEPRPSKKKLRKMKMFDKKIRRLQKQWQKAKNNLSRKDIGESGSDSSSDDVVEVETENRKGSYKNSTAGVPKKVKKSSKADHGSVH